VTARCRLRSRWLESTCLGFRYTMLQMYVSGVSFVSKVCCSCFLWTLEKWIGGCCICCKYFRSMSQAFVQNVSSVTYVCCTRFYLDVAYVFTHMLQKYVPNVSAALVLCCSKCFLMLQLFYLYVAYVSHTCCKRMSQMFYLFQMYVAFVCFMLQVKTADVGIHEGGQGQAGH
jgi:hypothetical protein